ncbi:MAG: UDP-N-acetylmuramate dehydrogenase [bacterium]|nr:UDP-N-acetylmuramate dehydrogenase [bacterium]
MNDRIKDLLLNTFGKDCVVFNVSAKNFTSFKTGGELAAVVFPSEKKHIEFLFNLSKEGVSVRFIGCGSNLLISDDGFDGIMAITKKISGISRSEKELSVLAGTKLSTLIKFCIKKDISGFEFLAGIPGTIGGALINNAGIKEKSISQVVLFVEYMDKNGLWQRKGKNEIIWDYRYSGLREKSFFVFSTVLIGEKGDPDQIKKKIALIMKKRKETQPLVFPSAGSVFKNPPGFFAGKLIDQAGLKGFKVGGAMVSEKHANFIVNTGNATSTDVFNLMKYIQKTIINRYNITLEPEIELLGRFP